MKRFAIGFAVAFLSIIIAHMVMGTIYARLGKPFYDSLIAGCVYSFCKGLLGAILCQFMVVRFADARLAMATTKATGVVYALADIGIWGWAQWVGNIPYDPGLFLQSFFLIMPWLVLGFALKQPILREPKSD